MSPIPPGRPHSAGPGETSLLCRFPGCPCPQVGLGGGGSTVLCPCFQPLNRDSWLLGELQSPSVSCSQVPRRHCGQVLNILPEMRDALTSTVTTSIWEPITYQTLNLTLNTAHRVPPTSCSLLSSVCRRDACVTMQFDFLTSTYF